MGAGHYEGWVGPAPPWTIKLALCDGFAFRVRRMVRVHPADLDYQTLAAFFSGGFHSASGRDHTREYCAEEEQIHAKQALCTSYKPLLQITISGR
jgi:hypothetical protein